MIDSREWGEYALIIGIVTAICMLWLSFAWYLILTSLALGVWVRWSREP